MQPRFPVFTTPGEWRQGQERGSRCQSFATDDLTWCPVTATANIGDKAKVTTLAQGPLAGKQVREPPGPVPCGLKALEGTCVWHPVHGVWVRVAPSSKGEEGEGTATSDPQVWGTACLPLFPLP